jgi:cytochrome c biogenesis protein CcdA
MPGLALLIASIGIADSINPSTVIPALWLAGTPTAGGLGSYALGVFAVYLAGGLALVFGPGPVLISSLRHVGGALEHVLLVAIGVVALAFALIAWRARNQSAGEPRARRSHTRLSGFLLGAGIMAIELPTAFMYFGAISAILADHVAAPAAISLLIAYNAMFVAPLVALLAVRRLAAARAERWIAGAEARLRRLGQLALSGVAGAAGTALLTVGLVGLI